MFSLLERKQHTSRIIKSVKNSLYNVTKNDTMSGYILVLFHWIVSGMSLLYLIMGEINYLYYLICFLFILTVGGHFYFNGCILTRIERHLWKEKYWWGPWMLLFTPLEYIGVKMNNKLADNIIYCGIILLTVIIIHNIKLNNKI